MPNALPIFINLANAMERYAVYVALRVHQLEGGRTLRRKRDLLQRDEDNPVLRPIVIAQFKVAFGELGIPANTVEQFVNRDHLIAAILSRAIEEPCGGERS